MSQPVTSRVCHHGQSIPGLTGPFHLLCSKTLIVLSHGLNKCGGIFDLLTEVINPVKIDVGHSFAYPSIILSKGYKFVVGGKHPPLIGELNFEPCLLQLRD